MTTRKAPVASTETKINLWLSVAAIIIPLLVTLGGGLVFLGSITSTIRDQISSVGKDVDLKIQPITSQVSEVSHKVDNAAKDAQSKVDILSVKQDALSDVVKNNLSEQQAFRNNVQNLFSKVFDGQQKATDALNLERVDRLTDSAKKGK